ncbi:MAG: dTDP-4-dehydrorhamnose 3,5-epimerase family protein [Chloroflexi bacterium]|nr:dTDP-4-dehydrorhamnose 3,5-epimerase family protein [Chloroflexota bacterium]
MVTTGSASGTGAKVSVDDAGISVPRLFDDDRARRACDVFGFTGDDKVQMAGDINITWAYPGRIVAWHRHRLQTDHWFVLKGYLKVGLLDDDGNARWVYLGENDRRVLSIPPSVWHGYMVLGDEEAVLMYYITSKYDEDNPDEERLSIEDAGIDWSVPVK